MITKFSTIAATLCLASITSTQALADYPEKKIDLIVGYAAGGGTDVMARTVAPFLEQYLGDDATVVVKNMPGASGQIGVTATAQADPDGYTIGTYNLPGMMARTLDRDADYDADSFTYLANVVDDPNVIVTPKSSDIDSMEKLVAAAQERDGAITVSMSSLGGDDHFFLIRLSEETDAEYTIVPFSGSAPARSALMGGHVAMGIINLSEVVNFRDELNVLGIATNERSELLEGVPTFTEQGYDLVNGSLRGFIAPSGLPEEVEASLISAFEKTYEDPKFQEAMLKSGNPISLTTGDDFQALNAEQLELAERVWESSPWK
ncbi:Bug family tripartite tricarboxylate transporter substrate binding protein [Vreelandella titanicae]|jgi:tripartite-type tricarboxylate transporter receptor subunit TctC|uniref:Bordetella uptake protein n=1 Tax=Vreelandella titanicae BH1 TaxID=1204738 RepID=L9UCF8_9GAMM|nr:MULTISPECIES: tripartite tricarboxylate transporter substrate binding protein [Halomonas]NAO94883.1 tripartite tricarboxylate transporter substrate binding protein [Halomonas sp. MG34]QGQ71852.1 tripartite tricarboxylate transporter substrate binding protein [Halomonas sp. PA16-9]ELY22655.1 Bordetella uptake protein [Halomonas titanicae BH1]KIN16773.1 receptor [Halomonas sp. KHS3]MCE7521031.1 tripartite tricarboxylate transporter substrate binding protein [Halomonas titanicae]|tara:strand:+ start:185 stop:1141 length:957 start_codon:yes stop_codon:yes gene_type:complete